MAMRVGLRVVLRAQWKQVARRGQYDIYASRIRYAIEHNAWLEKWLKHERTR